LIQSQIHFKTSGFDAGVEDDCDGSFADGEIRESLDPEILPLPELEDPVEYDKILIITTNSTKTAITERKNDKIALATGDIDMSFFLPLENKK